jgi:hypothetical protein
MTPREGQAALRRLLGPEATWSDSGKRTDPDDRERAKAQLPDLRARAEAAAKARDERKQALLAADEEYQRLVKEAEVIQKLLDEMESTSRHHRLSVGTGSGFFWIVEASGDNWADVIRKLKAKKGTGSR